MADEPNGWPERKKRCERPIGKLDAANANRSHRPVLSRIDELKATSAPDDVVVPLLPAPTGRTARPVESFGNAAQRIDRTPRVGSDGDDDVAARGAEHGAVSIWITVRGERGTAVGEPVAGPVRANPEDNRHNHQQQRQDHRAAQQDARQALHDGIVTAGVPHSGQRSGVARMS